LKKEITDLEKITNRTPKQEQKLKELKDKLAELEQGSNDSGGDSKKPTNYWLWIGGGIALVIIIGAIIYFLTRKKEPKKDYEDWK
jgi:ABC-type Fe3+-hydroxamate transport system substrate-binding protein